MQGGPRALLLAVRSAIRGAIHPEDACDEEGRRAFEDEARESNARTLRWIMSPLVPVHVLAVLLFVRRPEADPARATWIFWMVRLHAMEAVIAILAAVVAWRGRPAALWRVLGDAVGAAYLLGTAAMSANAQRAHPNLNAFVIATVASAFFLRMRPRVFAPSLLAGMAVVLAGVVRFRHDGAGSIADLTSLFGAVSVALFGFVVSRSMRFNQFLARRQELLARRQVEQLNAELERRVAAQVSEIVGRAREIEELNTRLNEQVRERSRELSMALARLAEGHQALAPGTVLGGRVAVEAQIGQGAMGVVYRGRDLVTNRTVAVKVVQAGSAHELDGLYRFLREAQAMASVTHPAIVRPIHVDVSDDGRLFQIMELIEGETLEACLARGGALPPPVAARLVAVLADALAAAHAAGVVHRDVKPSNVMLTRAAPGLKLLDFGISRLWDARATAGQTEGKIIGTPEFLSPEQVSAPASVAAPADVYALGILLYLCLAGRLPFDVDGPRNWLLTHVMDPPVEITKHVPDIDPALALTVMACLRKTPGERPTAAAMAATLSTIADAAGIPPLPALHPMPSAGTPRRLAEGLPTMEATARSIVDDEAESDPR